LAWVCARRDYKLSLSLEKRENFPGEVGDFPRFGEFSVLSVILHLGQNSIPCTKLSHSLNSGFPYILSTFAILTAFFSNFSSEIINY
jgi:hypothetical protein